MKKAGIAITILFIAFIICVCGGSILVRDREFSSNENRYLTQLPTPSWDSVRDGTFQEKLEKYLNDQVIGRDRWITLKTTVQKAMGDSDIGGAYVGKDGYDFEKITPEDVDDELVKRNTAAVRTYFEAAERMLAPERLSFLLVPTSGLIMKEKLPQNARLFDQNAYMDEIQAQMDGFNSVDVREELAAHSTEYIYYRTDHHWTTDGAYYAYRLWCDSVGMECADWDSLEKTVVTDEFRGSLYSKILDADSAYDSIWIYGQKGEGVREAADRFTVTVGAKEQPGMLYDESKLEEKDKYAFFFGGNEGKIHISGGSRTEGAGRNLLVVKDSFANAFVPFLVDSYDNVYMVDLRYYNGDMYELLEDDHITDVLVLYNISNFISDRNLYKLGGE